MSKINRTNFKTTKDTKYADNTNEEISALDSREVHEDLADSVVFKIDDSIKAATTTNSGNDYSVTLDYPSSLTGNHLFLLRINAVNTGAATLAITPTGGSALTAKSLCNNNGDDFASGDLIANVHHLFTYDSDADKFKEVGVHIKSQGSADTINVADGSGSWSSTNANITESGNSIILEVKAEGELDGSEYPELRVRNTRASSAWSSDAILGRLAYYSEDGSGAGSGVKAAIDFQTPNSPHSITDLSIKIDSNGSVDERLKILGNTGEVITYGDLTTGGNTTTLNDSASSSASIVKLQSTRASGNQTVGRIEGVQNGASIADLYFIRKSDQTSGGIRIRTANAGTLNDVFEIDEAGVVTFNSAFSFPNSDGTANQVLETDGSGNLTWTTALTSPTVSTYTPTLEFGGANVGLTYTIQSGEYTTVGKQCSVQIYVRVDDKGTSTGDITVSLPVAAKSTTPTVQILSCQVAPVSGGLNDVPYVARVSQGTSEVTLTEAFTSSAVVGTMDDADVGEPFIVLISGTYFTD